MFKLIIYVTVLFSVCTRIRRSLLKLIFPVIQCIRLSATLILNFYLCYGKVVNCPFNQLQIIGADVLSNRSESYYQCVIEPVSFILFFLGSVSFQTFPSRYKSQKRFNFILFVNSVL